MKNMAKAALLLLLIFSTSIMCSTVILASTTVDIDDKKETATTTISTVNASEQIQSPAVQGQGNEKEKEKTCWEKIRRVTEWNFFDWIFWLISVT